ncbi:ABC transporter permease DevC [Lacunimicrobium album]
MITNILIRLLHRLPIGWLQLNHNRTRLIAAVGGVTFANILIFMQLGFMGALFSTSVFTHKNLSTDLVLLPSNFLSLREATSFPRRRIYQAESHPAVVSADPIYIGQVFWTDPVGGDTAQFRVLGVPPDSPDPIFLNETIQAELPKLKQPDKAILDIKTRQLNPDITKTIFEKGSYDLELNNLQFHFVGTFSQGGSFGDDGSIIVSTDAFMRLFRNRQPGTPTLALIHLAPGSDAHKVAREINALLPEGDTIAMTKQQFIDAEQNYQAQQTPIGFVFGFGVVMAFVVGLVIVYQVLTTDVQDHLAEYATFKAIGYSQGFFRGIVFEEALSLAILGFVPGLVVSIFLYAFASRATGLPIEMQFGRPAFVFSLTLIMCVLSGLIATNRLAHADPADLF